MKTSPARFGRVFGVGPIGLLISLTLLSIVGWLNEQFNLPPIIKDQTVLITLFSVSCLVSWFILVWSSMSLRQEERGNNLCTSGPYRYVRHPRYAAFISVFNFGLALYLNSYLFILWAVLLHPIWNFLVSFEERRMIDTFGETYIEYQKKTGRFFPKLI
jgi:protein-S-isoprenylcysteine O-methyltransferase Ste14